MNEPVLPAPNAPARLPADTIPDGASGDRQSLAELDRRFRPALKAYFLKRAPGSVDAEDLVQDVFVRLAKRGEIAAIRQVEGYVFQTAANVLTDRVRRRAVRCRDAHVPYLDGDHRDEENSPESVLMGREALARLLDALRELPEQTRAIFVLHRFEQLRYGEIAKRLGLSVSSVEKHMMKALAQVTQRLEQRR